MQTGKKELEVKIINIGKSDLQYRLKREGYSCKVEEYLMQRKIFLFPDKSMNKWARVRKESEKVTMAIKQVTDNSSIDGVRECELVVDSFEDACELLGMCDLESGAIQENYREVWVKGEVEVTIDTWPELEAFMEIESTSEDLVRKACLELGYEYAEGLFGGVDIVYEKIKGIPKEKFNSLMHVTFDRFC